MNERTNERMDSYGEGWGGKGGCVTRQSLRVTMTSLQYTQDATANMGGRIWGDLETQLTSSIQLFLRSKSFCCASLSNSVNT